MQNKKGLIRLRRFACGANCPHQALKGAAQKGLPGRGQENGLETTANRCRLQEVSCFSTWLVVAPKKEQFVLSFIIATPAK